MERRRQAKQAEGAKIRAASAATPKSGVKQGRVRFYVAKDFRSQHSEWRAPLHNLVTAANDIAGPNFGVRFEVALTAEWAPACAPHDLAACLTELQRLDPGEDGDWVVGVLGAEPSFTTSFDDLGMARVPGRHFVLRDVSDLAERDAIERAFASLSAARREEIYKRRKAHKRLAAFLHEWGHTMGALHVDSSDSLLHPAYDDRMNSFDEANHGLIAAGLRDRFQYSGKHSELIAYLQGSAAASFRPDARESLLARLEAPVAPPAQVAAVALPSTPSSTAPDVTPSAPQHAFVVAGSEQDLTSSLEPADRATYQEAVKLTLASDTFGALKLIEPVAQRYPKNYAVQHLACGLAMQIGYQAMAQQACPRVPALASGK